MRIATQSIRTPLLSLILVMFCTTHALPQITVTRAALEQTLQSDADATQYISYDTDPIADLVNLSGPNQLWDFSQLEYESSLAGRYTTFSSPAGTPGGDDPHFGQATHVVKLEFSGTEEFEDEEYEVFMDFYVYMVLDDNEVRDLGGIAVQGVETEEIEEESFRVWFRPYSLMFDLPVTYEKTWESEYELEMEALGTELTQDLYVHSEVDGWGEVITPDGSVEVLRIKRTEVMDVFGIAFESFEYEFVAANGMIIATISGHDDDFNPEDDDLEATYFSYETAVTSIESQTDVPEKFFLGQNYPNPFNPTTVIPYRIVEPGYVEVSIYDIAGRKIDTLVKEMKPAGVHEVTFDGSDLSNGLYMYELRVNGRSVTQAMSLIK